MWKRDRGGRDREGVIRVEKLEREEIGEEIEERKNKRDIEREKKGQ